MLEYQNMKIFLQKAMFQIIPLSSNFAIKNVGNIVLWTYFVRDLNGEEIVGTFYEKEL